MRKDKGSALLLRKEGKSYREIEKELGIPRSTLSEWLRGVDWSKDVEKANTDRNISKSRERIAGLNKGRQERLEALYAQAEAKAGEDYQVFKHEPHFAAGLMIYAIAGDKAAGPLVRISSGEFHIHRTFIAFVRKYLGTEGDSVHFGLVVHQDSDIRECEVRWNRELGIAREDFSKTRIVRGGSAKRKLQFGTGMSILSGTVLKRRIGKWLELCALDAGLV